MRFDNQVVMITGAAGSLGKAVAAGFAAGGARLALADVSEAVLQQAYPGTADTRLLLPANLLDSASAQNAVNAAMQKFGRLDALCNIAGGFAMAPMDRTESASFAEMMETNVRTAFLCCRAALRAMLSSRVAGRIVNVAARAGLDPRRGAGMVAYTASKAAVAAMTVALAEEAKAKGILVNAIAPSTLDTATNRADMPDADFTKWVSLDAAADSIVYLASPANQAISGALVPVYGRA